MNRLLNVNPFVELDVVDCGAHPFSTPPLSPFLSSLPFSSQPDQADKCLTYCLLAFRFVCANRRRKDDLLRFGNRAPIVRRRLHDHHPANDFVRGSVQDYGQVDRTRRRVPSTGVDFGRCVSFSTFSPDPTRPRPFFSPSKILKLTHPLLTNLRRPHSRATHHAVALLGLRPAYGQS